MHRNWLYLLLAVSVGATSPKDPIVRAAEAFRSGEYALALGLYRQLLDELPDQRPAVEFNLAQCLFALDSADAAEAYFSRLKPLLQGHAALALRTNLALLADRKGRTAEALVLLEEALRVEPNYETARYNYELIKRRQQEPPPPPSSPPPLGPPPPANPPPTEADGGELPPASELSANEAQAALRQLRLREAEYLQQLRKDNGNRRRSAVGKPW
ncbi:MAG: hypothetical protein SFY70_01675 [Bacteroidia bacterium]|nr:hypothetical protein [Bacteroidia bacterium]